MHHVTNLDDSPDAAINAVFRDIIQQHATGVFDQAAQSVANDIPIDDPGILRIVFARLLLHETNPGTLAARAATLANAIARLTAAQRQGRDREADLRDEVDALLDEFDAARAGREGAPS